MAGMSSCIIDGKKIAEKINSVTRKLVQEFVGMGGRKPAIDLVQIGENRDSAKYISKKIKLAEELGIEARSHVLPSDTVMERAAHKIWTLAEASETDAILLQLPLPYRLREDLLLDMIPRYKDVDGITSASLGTLVRMRTGVLDRFEDDVFRMNLPCTPAGVLYLVEESVREVKGLDSPEGLNALVIGRSALVGAPTALLLQAAGVTVSTAHSATGSERLKELSLQADIIVSACGVPGIVTSEMVKEGSVLIDVGLSWVEGRGLVGDMDFEACSKKAAAITPVPGGVGPMTLAMLMRNVLICAEMNVLEQVGGTA
jgi:methylenetetrahydrofolate dehydrogenase (NADP+) / methenyltetrahydrofolate cyclohydrolase